jgi:N-acetyl-anhydromuramoyl-L-alanine amidase
MKKTITIILFFLVALAFAGAGGYYFWKNKGHQKITIKSEDVQTTSEKQTDAVVNEVAKPAENDPSNTADNTDGTNPAAPVQKENKVVERKKPTIQNKLVSFGFKVSSGRKIDAIIIHSSYNNLGGEKYDVDKLIEEYKQYQVAPHYLIGRKGSIYRLVADKNIAYHAGESKTPDGRTDVNEFSIGIELMNTEDDHYTDEQYQSLLWLVDALIIQYHPKYVLGHDDIASDRKTDPWNFDWDKFNKMLKDIS